MFYRDCYTSAWRGRGKGWFSAIGIDLSFDLHYHFLCEVMPTVIMEGVMRSTGIVQHIYETEIKNLPVIERLWLVKMVMDDLMNSPATWVVDESDEWSEEDYSDLERASLAYASRTLWEQEQ